MAAHAKLSASGAYRWSKCPGMIPLTKGVKSTSSVYAKVGTAAHKVSEFILRDGMEDAEALDALDLEENMLLEDEDMPEFWNAVYTYVNWVREKIEEAPSAQHLFEQRVDLGFIAPNMFGTGDYLRVDLFEEIIVGDYKHGKGIVVEVEDNSQFGYYGLAAAHQYGYNFESVTTAVIQPRAPHHQGAIRTETLPMNEFREKWTDFFTDAVSRVRDAEKAKNIEKHLNPGDHCKFCPALENNLCPAIAKKAKELARMDFDAIDPSPVDPKSLNPSEIAVVLNHSKMIDGWIAAVAEHAQSLLESGVDVPGYELKNKRATRQWIDKKKVLTNLKRRKTLTPEDYLAEPKLLSPNQMEQKHKRENPKLWAAMEKHIHKISSGKTIGKIADKTQAKLERKDAKDDFDAIEVE